MFRYALITALLLSLILAGCCCPTGKREATASPSTPQANLEATPQETPVEEKPTPAPAAEEEPTSTPAAEEEPTSAPEPTAAPVTAEAGLSRSNPLPLGTEFVGNNWSITVTGVTRGEEAAQIVADANIFNEPPREGYEYLIADISLTNISEDDEAKAAPHAIDLRVTGDRNTLYPNASVAPPKRLEGELFPGGTAEGQLVFEVPSDEGNLQFRVAELWSFDPEAARFIAIDEGASVAPDPALQDIKPTDVGRKRAAPARIGDTLVTDYWQFSILEAVRGDEAAQMVADASLLNEPAPDGQEYVVVKLAARYLGTGKPDFSETIDAYYLKITGEDNVVYDRPWVVDPAPTLNATLYPGGETEGWVILTAGQGEKGLLLIFEPTFSFSSEDVRYIALD